MNYRCFVFFLFISFGYPLYAESAAVLEGLQLPAWVERDGVKDALIPGVSMRAGDRIETGGNARVLLRLAEGSTVKLGENANFVVQDIQAGSSITAFLSVLNVIRGAFRFTTTSKDKQRDVKISVGTVTIGIRGTDVWGKSDNVRDLVCLIEGEIELQHQDEPQFRMSDALTVFKAPHGEISKPIAPVDMQQLESWAQETELQSGVGVLKQGGEYTVYLFSGRNAEHAKRVSQKYRAAGYPAVVTEHEVQGGVWHRVGIAHFASSNGAQEFAKQMEGILGTTGAWIRKVRT